MKLLVKLGNFCSRNMALMSVLTALSAYFAPATYTWALHYIPLLLGVVMFGMGLTLKLSDFKLVAKNPKYVVIGVLAQFFIMPALAWTLVKVFQLPPELALGVILVGTCPGGTSSNVMTFLAKGDVALSVALSICTTVLAPVVTPFLTWLLADQWFHIPVWAMFFSIVKIVILPVVLGVVINTFFSKQVEASISVLPLVSVFAILLIMGGVVSAAGAKVATAGWVVLLVVIMHNLLGYLTGFGLAKKLNFGLPQTKTVAIEVGMQNSGLATTLAMALFSPMTALPAVAFSVWHIISGALIANYFSRIKEEDATEVKVNTVEAA